MQRKTAKEPRLIVGVIILLASNIIVKVIGVLFKIPLHNLLGDRGMSYFNVAYNLFTTLYLISTAGLPTAISLMVSEARIKGRKCEVKHIFYTSLVLFFILGIIGTSIMLFGSGGLAKIMGSPDSSLAIAAVSPTLFLICISSSIRGYFQGHQNMFPTAASEVIESIGKFALGILFGIWAVNSGKSIEICAAYAIAGVAIGEAAGMIFLICAKLLHRQDYSYTRIEDDGVISAPKKILANLLMISIPVMLSSVALNLTSTVDTFTIINILKKCITPEAAETAYGNYTTLAVTLFHLPSAFIYPISTSLAPALSAVRASGNKEKAEITLKASFKMTAIISVPCAIGMAIMSKPILGLLFKNSASVASAAPLLSILSPAIFFSAILTVTSAALQSYGHQNKPIISMVCGIITKLIVSCALMSVKSIGILGAPIGTLASYLVMAAVNFAFVIKYVGIQINIFKLIAKPLAASGIASVATVGAYMLIKNLSSRPNVATLASVFITVIIYFLLLFLLCEFRKSDIIMFPIGEKLYNFLCRIKLMKPEKQVTESGDSGEIK